MADLSRSRRVDHLALLRHLADSSVRERAVGVSIWVVVILCRSGRALAVALRQSERWTEEDVGERVRTTFQSHLRIPRVVLRVALVERVRERTGGADEVLRSRLRSHVGVAVVPSYRTVQRERLAVLVIEVRGSHVGRVETVASHSEGATSAATRESHVAGVVERTESHHAQL